MARDQLYSSSDVAAEIGCTPRTVQRLAAQHQVGSQVGRALVFTAADVRRLRGLVRPVGNPLMGPGQPAGYGRAGKKGSRTP